MKINVTCPVNTTSYGYVSSYFMKGLLELGCDVKHVPMFSEHEIDEDLSPYLNKILGDFRFHHDATSLKIWHQHDMTGFTGNGKKVGFPIFELETFNDRESHSLRYPDFLFVASKWAKERLLANNISSEDNIFVVPLGFNEDIFIPCKMPKSEHTIFGNFGKWEVRKGHDVLYKAFCDAFGKKDNGEVYLIMVPSNRFLTDSERRYWENLYSGSDSRVKILPRQPSQSLVYKIMSQIHCAVFPARAEGWNLEALESLAIGKHLIITDCTAHSEYASDKNSRLIKMSSGFEKAEDGKFFNGSSYWRKFGSDEHEQLVEHMRSVHRERMSGNLSVNTAGIETVKNFTWGKCSKILYDNLLEVS